MTRIRIFFLLILIFCSLPIVRAQDKAIKFNLVTASNGKPLTDGNINSITQDTYGYMWFTVQGTGYVCRYDGNHIVTFKHDNAKENSPSRAEPETIYGDRQGMVWIGYFNGDLDRYSLATGVFTHYKHDPNDSASLSEGMVSVITRDHLGRLWVGTGNGLDRLDEKTGRFTHFRNDPRNPKSLSCNIVRSICEDREGVLWIGTGFEFSRDSTGGLNRMNPDESFSRFVHDPKNPNSLNNNKVRVIFEDSRGTLWIGTSGDGLYTMNRGKTVFERHMYDPRKPEQLSRPPLLKEPLFDPITFIREDGNGAIWIGTVNSGVNRYDTTTKTITHYKNNSGFPEDGAWTAFKSRDGVFWLAAMEGNPFLYRVDASANQLKETITGGMTVSLQNDRTGNIWASVLAKGVLQYDEHMHLIRQRKVEKGDSIDFSHAEIIPFYPDHRDTLWLSTSDGVTFLDTKTSQTGFLTYREGPDSAPKKFNGITSITRRKNGHLWLAAYEDGMIDYNPSGGLIKTYLPYPKDRADLQHNSVLNILEDSSGASWAAISYMNYKSMDQGMGIIRLNMETGQFKYYLDGIGCLFLFRDSKGVLWAGTVNGLYRYFSQTDSFSLFFDEESGLRNLWSHQMIEDSAGNLWVSGNSIFVKINSNRNRHFIYGKKYGIKEEGLLFGGLAETSSGQILVGNKTGFYSFFPREMVSDNQTLSIAVSDFSVNNKHIFSGDSSILQKPIEETEEIDLKYNQNNFDFHVSVFDYRAPESNRVYTMLENFDNQWTESSGDKYVRFLNVPPGHYNFKVRASNVDGVQAERSIRITIHPPLWKTTWAYTIYVLMILIASFLMNRILRQRAISHERQKAQVKELAQAKEIERAYTDLKNTQAQLLQSEKMASLGELTAGIAHEIQNPLNFVNNFSDVNSELLTEMDEEIDKGNMQEIRSLAKNIRENEEKIIQHGKRADAIVKSMLQHSRTSVGQKEPVDLNALTDEYLRLSFHGFRAKDKLFHANIKTDFDGTVGKINIVPQEIGRVLLNLYNNAFYALYEKSKQSISGFEPLVTVYTKRTENKIEIVIRDNGNGIPKQVSDKIFQPFFTTKPAGQGTGLGLSLSYDIIKAHGGEIKVNTKENEFTEFTLVLPVHS